MDAACNSVINLPLLRKKGQTAFDYLGWRDFELGEHPRQSAVNCFVAAAIRMVFE